ncbi:MAG: C10 family peptidase [Bacteroidales bacterium]|nr:C10 family peptidase [Bacteroidales bacterium]
MKKAFLSLLLVAAALRAISAEVPEHVAQQAAANYLAAKLGTKDAMPQCLHRHTHRGEVQLYLFARPDGGFVLMAADDAVEPVLGYSPDGRAADPSANPSVRWWLNRYAQQVYAMRRAGNGAKGVHPQWSKLLSSTPLGAPANTHEAKYLMRSTWDQSGEGSRFRSGYKPLYDKYCPDSAGVKAYVGCVATAMSQIMYYHKWPQKGRGWYKYEHKQFGLQMADFGAAPYDWANMPNRLTSSSTDAQIDAVATLCRHAGVSVSMGYGIDGSGAYERDALAALITYFGYDPNSIRLCDVDTITGKLHVDGAQRETYAVIKAEIDAKRPILISGSSEADGGHAFVCDGYDDESQKVHINWGWDGNYDGYYSIAALAPTSPLSTSPVADFSEKVDMIIGIAPQKSGAATPASEQWVIQPSNLAQYRGIRQFVPLNGKECWAIAYDGMGAGYDANRDFVRTIDGGRTWTVGQVGGDEYRHYEATMLAAIDANTAFATVLLADESTLQTQTGMVSTSDGGLTWKKIPGVYTNSVSFANVVCLWENGKGFAQGDPVSGYFEVYTTADSGRTWVRVPRASIPDPSKGKNGQNDEYGTVGYAEVIEGGIGWFTTNRGNIYRTTDYGQTWTKHTIDAQVDFALTTRFKNANEGVAFGRKAKPTKEYQYYLYRTTDGGSSWKAMTPKGDFNMNDMDYIPGTDTLLSVGAEYSSSRMGISYAVQADVSTDAITFHDYAPHYRNSAFLSVAVAKDGAAWSGGWVYEYGGIWYKPAPGYVEDSVIADFDVSRRVIPINDPTATFTDRTYGPTDSLFWDFGLTATPSIAMGIGPHTVRYATSTEGYRSASLTVWRDSICRKVIKPHAVYVGTPLAVETVAMEPSVVAPPHLLYPNPVSSTDAYVIVSNFERGLIQLFDLQGNLLWRSEARGTDGRVYVGNLRPGIYLVRIYDASKGTAATLRLVVAQ